MKKIFLSNESFKKEVRELYCSLNYELYAERYSMLTNDHTKAYGEPDIYISSPGRIELLGNHTDHNNGKVLCASISIDTIGAVSKRTDMKVVVNSIGFPIIDINLNDLKPEGGEGGSSSALVKGIADYLVKKGKNIGGFTATTTTDVFKGAGVSSSAAFELFIAECFNVLYNNSELDAVFKAQASQYAENRFFMKPCGMMDQCAIALGGVSYIDFKDNTNPEVKSHKWLWDDCLSLVLINTGGDHADLTNDYASIRLDMEKIASYFDKKSLRSVDEFEFRKNLSTLKNKFSGRSILRSIHFFDENKRVADASYAISSNNIEAFLHNINNSGNSSYKLLQNCYTPNDTTQNIPLALAIAENQTGLKAVRVHGGGFAGTILCFIEKEYIAEFLTEMNIIYGQDNVFQIGIRNSGARQVKI